MPRVRLTTRDERAIPYHLPSDRSGALLTIPNYRLILTVVCVPPDADVRYRPIAEMDLSRRVRAVVDTGAPLTVLGRQVWEPIADEVRWLSQPPTAGGQPRRLTILGGRWSYRLGQIRLAAFDDDGRWLPPVWTPTLLLDESGSISRLAALGLRSPLLDRRQLRHAGSTGDRPVWWLEDAAG